MNIPPGYVEMEDGSYAKLSMIQTGLVRGKPKATATNEREADIHRRILAYCRGLGWVVHHSRMDVPATCGVGSPDFVVALPGDRTLWVEVKTAKGKVRPEQAAWIRRLQNLGHKAGVVRSLQEFVEMAKEVMNEQ
jgi:hypothetical protein